ncbi:MULTISPECIES: type II toxin-antitoxin system VapC family toxin [Cyanophyceae]|uniref:Nuclease n=1 Tax=Nodularia spumigena CENA596 TaxID=1819295 RepID=A0A161XLL1_NODSP|nr:MULTISPECIES: PIN domain-containing protein [Cyanophyceae]MDB9358089.1 PIN domain-containing protein [Nodularia spumigena CS-587/03]KZL50721.1 nuclease [Nodularia spumigena CENA596]MDB9306639.1 PIN domain-containing protein [Nodularia spumigena CS-591/12]MDB9316124.1 PIN domain-containing protein [Nodularia spumigena CS-590/01A]MDB9321940.1 PIN domain-containing protein [Nodularia spumigena CS-591/07A]
MKITYIDSGVLLSATDGVGIIAEKALQILGDSQREFASSEFVKLEVSPKAIYNKQTEEAQFYEEFFGDVTYWANDLTHIVQEGYQIAAQYGLAAMDALHVAAALSVGAEEFVTTEKKTKPMFRVSSLKVVSIFD